ncbi:hypothetical protein [Yoonia sp. BS5-3]|uniref:Glycosyltransferase RgtA/B/C/D-like domain-containing protein n=1 Tax=Yoonia phaeophyticola TaxID=3137369 RepID=A0ABZ2V2U4_9RHOB
MLRSISRPTLGYIIIATLVLGPIALLAAFNMQLEPPVSDIWQHAAAIRALIADLANPANPFVVSDEGSRHFQPLWVAGAAVAQLFGLTEWDILRAAAILSMFVFGAGIFLFSRAFYSAPWAPVALLLTLIFAWLIRPQHTGLHSFHTLVYSAAYPATFLIGFSFILWAWTIRTVEGAVSPWRLVLLSLFMLTTHQLGAAIGLTVAGCFAVCWPGASLRIRVITLAAMAAGVLLSMLWPYHNPVLQMIGGAGSSWVGGTGFYTSQYMAAAFLPAGLGLLAFYQRKYWAVAMGFVILSGLFLLGLVGVTIAGRFLMPMILLMHIGLAGLILQIFEDPQRDRSQKGLLVGIAALTVAFLHCFYLYWAIGVEQRQRAAETHVFAAVRALTSDIPDLEPVAAISGTAWETVATGQRIIAIPWPEPEIHDLQERQAALARIADPQTSLAQRRSIAAQYDVRVLIADTDNLPEATVALFREQAVRVRSVGSVMRFDLFD